MNKVFAAIVALSIAISVFAAPSDRNAQVAGMILNDSNVMGSIEAKLKTLLPTLVMRFSGIEISTSGDKYSAVVTYTDTAKDTFFHPAFGNCSLLVRGSVKGTSLTVDQIREESCGE